MTDLITFAESQLAAVHVRHSGQFAHVDGELAAGESIRLMRLHQGGSVTTWGFALCLATPGV
ncbi:hypothetical protein OG601_15465 [Streptomyces sp. NBC_01239]|uniref:hypothetical protein n=1 Tax=Streptomyces sp. NBC_01239 TaxID=2903792 RepID=UPI00225493F1|nr:hypothetical protein [Streptomyces sp. NBC_01239]MCX4812004.1 hypothetical protein [Streptomyces sp. NBC_01239]